MLRFRLSIFFLSVFIATLFILAVPNPASAASQNGSWNNLPGCQETGPASGCTASFIGSVQVNYGWGAFLWVDGVPYGTCTDVIESSGPEQWTTCSFNESFFISNAQGQRSAGFVTYASDWSSSNNGGIGIDKIYISNQCIIGSYTPSGGLAPSVYDITTNWQVGFGGAVGKPVITFQNNVPFSKAGTSETIWVGMPSGYYCMPTTFIGGCTGGSCPVTQTYTAADPTTSLTANSTTIPYNTSTMLNWSSANATACAAGNTQGLASWSGSKPPNTSGTNTTGNLTSPTGFLLHCDGFAGTSPSESSVVVNLTTMLTVTKLGMGSGTVTGPGINYGADPSESYPIGTPVSLTGTPSGGSSPVIWGGDCDASGNVTMSINRTCTATFNLIPVTYNLTINKAGVGTGTVTGVSIPAQTNINCGVACSTTSIPYSSGTTITLTGSPAGGSDPVIWGGDPDCFDGFVTMNIGKTCTATFNLSGGGPYTLNINKQGLNAGTSIVFTAPAGSGIINCGSDCSEPGLISGTTVTLDQTVPVGFFDGWTVVPAGNISAGCGTNQTCTVRMNSDTTVTATFNPHYDLDISKSGAGTGTVTGVSNPVQTDINCGVSCASQVRSYTVNTTVTLTATASAGSFMGWSGNADCLDGNVTMNSFVACVATFDFPSTLGVTLTVTPSSGTAPVNSTLSATVSGTATGTINYSFWWNCSYTGTSVASAITSCGDPDGTTGNANGNKFDTVAATSKSSIVHTYLAGTYTTKAIVERGTAAPAEQRLTFTISSSSVPPVVAAGSVAVTEPDYCTSGPGAMVNWTYTDADGNAQSTYQLQIDNDIAFTSPEWDSGVVPQVVSSGSTGSHNTASFGACLATNPSGTGTGTCRLTWNSGSDPDYRARVRVWDSTGLASGWVSQSSCTGPGCGGGGVIWKTPKHAYPLVDFSFTPASPNAGQNTQFTDTTIFSDAGSSGNRSWNWTFGDGTSSNNQNPAHTYALQGIYNVTDNASDKNNYTCARSKPITVQQKVPIWKEVSPR